MSTFNDTDDDYLAERVECREVVKKITDFGITQRQVAMLIEMLAMELENREAMLLINQTARELQNGPFNTDK
jgi:hypothetical protein